ncbi:MAG: TIGR03905 family TSCPD domain-containing protein [Bacteroides sp.]|nr:TIGR03905 family TSCPD domain-containing protein [Eubacterium sp.]MCM1417161.1 TIGR03905 family TSCPD domain-containing protein [Roseburia sp.]MCM1461218.1 TIGR03905 family TSCPD domain-containing protein [Bacteroides sp.]
MTYEYTPKGVCSRKMVIEINDGVLTDLKVIGGCNGNLQGISALVKGMKIDEVIRRLDGINCNMKGTSCPDQLAQALKEIGA